MIDLPTTEEEMHERFLGFRDAEGREVHDDGYRVRDWFDAGMGYRGPDAGGVEPVFLEVEDHRGARCEELRGEIQEHECMLRDIERDLHLTPSDEVLQADAAEVRGELHDMRDELAELEGRV